MKTRQKLKCVLMQVEDQGTLIEELRAEVEALRWSEKGKRSYEYDFGARLHTLEIVLKDASGCVLRCKAFRLYNECVHFPAKPPLVEPCK